MSGTNPADRVKWIDQPWNKEAEEKPRTVSFYVAGDRCEGQGPAPADTSQGGTYTGIFTTVLPGLHTRNRVMGTKLGVAEVVDLGFAVPREYLRPLARAFASAADNDGTADESDTIDGVPFRVTVMDSGGPK